MGEPLSPRISEALRVSTSRKSEASWRISGRAGSAPLNRLIYTSKESGEVASVKTHRLVYTVRDGKIVRYELENLDESEVAGSPAD